MKPCHHPMQPGDIRECVDLIANHPVFGPRYGSAIEDLPQAWARMLQTEASSAFVFYACEDSRAPISCCGVTAFVRDDFLLELKAPPHFWIGPELTRRIVRGESPVLTGKELREANSRDGLNMVCWEACPRPDDEANAELQRYLMSIFIQEHRGYLWKEVISSQIADTDHLAFVLRTGGYIWDPLAEAYTSILPKDPSEIAGAPHVLGIARDLELKREANWAGSWVGALFDYHPPLLGFSRSEQRLLSSAQPGATDEQLAGILGTSLSAVKKLWVSIYRRAEGALPEVIHGSNHSDLPPSGRGREKRRVLLAYVREHPEELRPVSRTSFGKHNRTKLVAK